MDKGLFKTSVFGGFKKADVLSFIEEETRSAGEKEKRLREDLEKTRSELNAERENSKKLAESNAQLEKSLEKAGSDIRESDEQKHRLVDEIALKENDLRQKNGEMENLRRETLLLRQKLNDSASELLQKETDISALKKQKDALEHKLADVSQTEEQIARVMIDARRWADSILFQARQKADEVQKEACEGVKSIAEAIKGFDTQVGDLKGKTESFGELSGTLLDTVHNYAASLIEKIDVFIQNGPDAPAGFPKFDFSSGAAEASASSDLDEKEKSNE